MTLYTLFGQSGGAAIASDSAKYTFGVQFSVSSPGTLAGIWFNSPATAVVLPGTIALYAVSGTSLVHSESASWSGAAGSGWVHASFSSPPSLTASTNYKACVFGGTGIPGDNMYGSTGAYWSSGAGSGGITNGPLSAPANGSASAGQDVYDASGALAYPATTFNAANYWVDPEVSIAGGNANTATGTLALAPAFSDHQNPGPVVALGLAPGFASVKSEKHLQAMTVTPRFAAIGLKNFGKGGTPDRHHRRGSW